MEVKVPLFGLGEVSYHYLDGIAALQGINLSIMPGEKVAIVGTNGSGKTTLLKLLDGLYFPTTGEIRAFGEPLTEKRFQGETGAFAFRSRVGLLFQNPDIQLFSPTVGDELAFGPLQMGLSGEEVEIRVEKSLNTLGIENLKKRAPYHLSAGEKKKVALASLLSFDPEVWLLDEPTANLDPRTQGWMIDFLLSLAEQGKTLVVATHQLKIARIVSQQVCVLGEDHCLLAQGPPSTILRDEELLLSANLIYSRSPHLSPF